jgi:V/A-type H+-transporting ATPase subunit I
MIARMSRVEIVGEKSLLRDVLSLLKEMGIFHIEPPGEGLPEKEGKRLVRAVLADEKTVFKRLFLEDLRNRINELFSLLPKIPIRKSYIEPESIISTFSYTIKKHLAIGRELQGKKLFAEQKVSDQQRYLDFFNTLKSVSEETSTPANVDFIGLTIKDPGVVKHLGAMLWGLTGGKFKILTVPAGDGTLSGLIMIDKDLSETVTRELALDNIPEMSFPPALSDLSLSEKIAYLKDRMSELRSQIEAINVKLETLCRRWVPIYVAVQNWIDESLAQIKAIAAVQYTEMCFFVHGWIPSKEQDVLERKLNDLFEGKVVLNEMEIRENDLERMPSVLQNPPYFRPFELFTRFLPLPAYTSYDPTTFIGIFFPIFFGLILGDAGYGTILGITALILIRKFREKKIVRDGAKILLIASLYTIIFGILFGEFFGDLPQRLLGLTPLWLERRTAIIPMMYFTLGIGTVHIILGLLLGAITAFRKKAKREAVYKLLNISVILGLIAVMTSFFGLFSALLTKPLIIIILVTIPFLFFTGGILAPLELLKNISNIISYIRIMAIGITSVLLAYVANTLAGLTGNIALGVFIAGSLHILNIILGVFSPTIHALRLHYVEFFSKFIESGGKKFEPLRK